MKSMSSRSTSANNNQLGLGKLLSSKEKLHYSKALNEMHEIVRLENLRMQLSRSESEDDFEDETETYNATTDDYSGTRRV